MLEFSAAHTSPLNRFWSEAFAKATHGHTFPIEAAIEASLTEARDFAENQIIFPGAHVLDLGCGNGRQIVGLIQEKIGSYVGIDPIKESIEFCNREIASHVHGCQFFHIDLFNEFYNPAGKIRPEEFRASFDDHAFDSVITGSVFTHLGTAEICMRYLREISRVLKPHGKLFSSWFRSPPNDLTADRARSVFNEGEILNMVTQYFQIYHSRGGFQGEFHDQWCLYGKKH
jgi:SAM-dependent methyltransferase